MLNGVQRFQIYVLLQCHQISFIVLTDCAIIIRILYYYSLEWYDVRTSVFFNFCEEIPSQNLLFLIQVSLMSQI